MKILIAGSNSRNSEKFTKEFNLGKLYSILSERNDIQKYDDNYFLMVDSGAHSWNKNNITNIGVKGRTKLPYYKKYMQDYSSFIYKNRKKKFVFVEFDIYGVAKKKFIDDYFHKINNVKDKKYKFIRVYHPILDDGSLSVLKEWISEGQDYIGIGNDSTELLDKIFLLTEDKVKIHGFAMTKMWMLEKYPFYSVDSTTALSTVMFGNYSRDGISTVSKDKIILEKSIEIFQGDEERLYNAIRNVKKTQDYLTELWKKRGVIWNNVF